MFVSTLAKLMHLTAMSRVIMDQKICRVIEDAKDEVHKVLDQSSCRRLDVYTISGMHL